MAAMSFKTRILISYVAIIGIFSVLMAMAGYFVIKKQVIDRAQAKVESYLNFAREVYREQTRRVEDVVRFTAVRFFIKDAISKNDLAVLCDRLNEVRQQEHLDMLTLVDGQGTVIVRSRNPSVTGDSQKDDEFVKRALSEKNALSGTVIIASDELVKEGADLAVRAHIEVVPTPKAKPTSEIAYKQGMMIKSAVPVLDYDGRLIGVLYGGNLLNRNYDIVDSIKSVLYRDTKYAGKEIGTVTIFQEDLRISTNVCNSDGSRAIGTRVSEEVYNQVLEKGQPWVNRAFVVNDWYKTAYEPIRGVDEKIIGMLYVGILEKPFVDIAKNCMIIFMLITAGVTVLAIATSVILSGQLTKPIRSVVKAAGKLSEGQPGHIVETGSELKELNQLVRSFNYMSENIQEREKSLCVSNEKLTDLNKRYIDLIGFVSHELKGILSSVVINAYSVRDEYLGPLNDKQKNALEAVSRNLDYLSATVKKFLNLGKIEKGDLKANKSLVKLKKDVFDTTIDALVPVAQRRNIAIDNRISPDVEVNADADLMQIVANNLICNAINYGTEYGSIILSSSVADGEVQVEVYNDSMPITEQQKERLFKRFNRLDNEQTRRTKGTGLGLFITKEIIETHGGKIWVEPRQKGNSFIFCLQKRQEQYRA